MSRNFSIKVSKAMSFALRHQPETFGIALTHEGWVSVTNLAEALSNHFNVEITVENVLAIAEADTKQRFTVTRGCIRAAQGHTFEVELNLVAVEPPAVLFHGTVEKFVESILIHGLLPQQREFVHLSATVETAREVGSRRGEPVILTVQAGQAHKAGLEFFQAENGVWLTKFVPAGLLSTNKGE